MASGSAVLMACGNCDGSHRHWRGDTLLTIPQHQLMLVTPRCLCTSAVMPAHKATSGPAVKLKYKRGLGVVLVFTLEPAR